MCRAVADTVACFCASLLPIVFCLSLWPIVANDCSRISGISRGSRLNAIRNRQSLGQSGGQSVWTVRPYRTFSVCCAEV
jgi:hypothetical protein